MEEFGYSLQGLSELQQQHASLQQLQTKNQELREKTQSLIDELIKKHSETTKLVSTINSFCEKMNNVKRPLQFAMLDILKMRNGEPPDGQVSVSKEESMKSFQYRLEESKLRAEARKRIPVNIERKSFSANFDEQLERTLNFASELYRMRTGKEVNDVYTELDWDKIASCVQQSKFDCMHRWRNRFSEIEEAESYERDNTESVKKTKSRKRKKLSKKITQTATKRTRKESQNNEFHESNDDWFENYLNYMKEHKNSRVSAQAFFHQTPKAFEEPEWTAEEDAKILFLYHNYNAIQWEQFSDETGHSESEGAKRLLKLIGIKRGRWEEEEDKRLLLSLALCNGKYSAASRHIPGRNQIQCNERYKNSIREDIKRAHWTKEEDKQILELYKTCNGKWSEMAKQMPMRTDSAVCKICKKCIV